jgi:hypothetical protein
MTFVTVLATVPLSGTLAIVGGGIGATFTYALNPTTENAIGILPTGAVIKYGARYLDDAFYYGDMLENYVEAYEAYDNVRSVWQVTDGN